MTAIREAQIYNRLWKRLGLRRSVPLPPGAGTCRTPPVVGTDDQILDQLLAQTTGYQPRRSEA